MKRRGPKVSIPDKEVGRQAVESMRGYTYQLYASAQAWLSLSKDQTLLIEVAEDYAIAAVNALKAVQVKNTKGSVTLRTPSVIAAINCLWRFQKANPKLDVQSIYLTTSQIGREQKARFPGDVPGLSFWHEAAHKQIDLRGLRNFLAELPLDAELKTWIAAVPDEEIRSRLLNRISWECGSLALAPLAESVTNTIITYCESYAVAPSEACRARDAILVELLQIAATPGERRLNRAQLLKIIENATMVAVPTASIRSWTNQRQENAYQPPLHLRERESDNDRLFFFGSKDRVPFLGRQKEFSVLSGWLAEKNDFSWTLLTGPAGVGKSRLALELCLHAKENGWHAGFLIGGSATPNAAQFARFRPERPTLIVIDYISEVPEKAGEIVRVLIEASILKLIDHPVRLLLIERSLQQSSWWPRFTEGHAQLMKGYSALLAHDRRYLNLHGLDDNVLWKIIQHVAGRGHDSDRERIINALKQIDASGRPLFAALAADALRNGRKIWQFSKIGLLNDIWQREQRRWKSLAKDENTLVAHENAAALSTMVGGLYIPWETPHISSEHFPFTHKRYVPELMGTICGLDEIVDFIPPITPDIVGEWFVIQLLRKKHPFDERPEQLMSAAELRAALSSSDAELFGAFRSRAAEDFPEEVSKTDLFRAPSYLYASHEITEWAFSLADAMRHSCIDYRTAGELFSKLCQLKKGIEDQDLYRALANVYSDYAKMLADEGRTETAISLCFELLILAQSKIDIPDLGWVASDLGHRLGNDCLAMGDVARATEVFENLLDHAHKFQAIDNAEKEEIAEDAASLGLSIRREHIRTGNEEAIGTLNGILWGHRSNKNVAPIDLAGRSGLVMMQSSGDGELGTPEQIYAELKERSQARSDVPEIAFWAANVGYGIIRDAKDHRQFVENIIDLSKWLEPRTDWPDMPDVIDDAVKNKWITEDFRLGRKAVEAIYELWSSSLEAVSRRAGDINSDNQLRSTREDLERALAVHDRSWWAHRMRQRIKACEEAAQKRRSK